MSSQSRFVSHIRDQPETIRNPRHLACNHTLNRDAAQNCHHRLCESISRCPRVAFRIANSVRRSHRGHRVRAQVARLVLSSWWILIKQNPSPPRGAKPDRLARSGTGWDGDTLVGGRREHNRMPRVLRPGRDSNRAGVVVALTKRARKRITASTCRPRPPRECGLDHAR